MRKEFIEVETSEEAYDAAPWVSIVIEVNGGLMAFESHDEYVTWAMQI